MNQGSRAKSHSGCRCLQPVLTEKYAILTFDAYLNICIITKRYLLNQLYIFLIFGTQQKMSIKQLYYSKTRLKELFDAVCSKLYFFRIKDI